MKRNNYMEPMIDIMDLEVGGVILEGSYDDWNDGTIYPGDDNNLGNL